MSVASPCSVKTAKRRPRLYQRTKTLRSDDFDLSWPLDDLSEINLMGGWTMDVARKIKSAVVCDLVKIDHSRCT